jgi:hypothetical protein
MLKQCLLTNQGALSKQIQISKVCVLTLIPVFCSKMNFEACIVFYTKCAPFVEWNALYTTQLTQKAKKYHDGIIRLMQIGSHARQVRNWCPVTLFSK